MSDGAPSPAPAAAVVYCIDEHRVAAFYAALGALAPVESVDGDFVTLESSHLQLSFIRVPPEVATAYPLADPVQRRSETPLKVVLPVVSLAAARAAAPALGGSVDEVGREWEFRGGLHVDAVDPEGNVVSLREPL
jgi:hypothetical protein